MVTELKSCRKQASLLVGRGNRAETAISALPNEQRRCEVSGSIDSTYYKPRTTWTTVRE